MPGERRGTHTTYHARALSTPARRGAASLGGGRACFLHYSSCVLISTWHAITQNIRGIAIGIATRVDGISQRRAGLDPATSEIPRHVESKSVVIAERVEGIVLLRAEDCSHFQLDGPRVAHAPARLNQATACKPSHGH